MAKLNGKLRAELVFQKTEMESTTGAINIIISTTYKGIYRQYSYFNYPADLKGNPQDHARLEEEAKNILTWEIEKELNKAK